MLWMSPEALVHGFAVICYVGCQLIYEMAFVDTIFYALLKIPSLWFLGKINFYCIPAIVLLLIASRSNGENLGQQQLRGFTATAG